MEKMHGLNRNLQNNLLTAWGNWIFPKKYMLMATLKENKRY